MFCPSPAQQRALARIEEFCGIRNPRTEFVDAAAFQMYWELVSQRADATRRAQIETTPAVRVQNRTTRLQAQVEALRDPERLAKVGADYARRFQPSAEALRQYLKRKCADPDMCTAAYARIAHLVCDDVRVVELAEMLQRQGRHSQDITTRLRQRGFPAALIDRCVADLSRETGSLLDPTAVQRKVATLQRKGLSQQVMRGRLMGSTADAAVVQAAMAQTLGEAGDQDALRLAYVKLARRPRPEPEMIQRLLAKGFRYADIRAYLVRLKDEPA
jgi:SOS response regulatory protein OraA/RecX